MERDERTQTTGDGARAPSVADTLVDEERSSPGELASATARAAASSGRLRRGDVVGRYVVVDELGSGAMGVVYAAYDPDLDRKLAIKLLSDAGRNRDGAEGRRARLVREAQAMAKLTHPNVVTVHDVGTFLGQVYVVMEFVEGSTLTTWLATKRRPAPEIVEMFLAAGQGLVAAHEKGLVHRDFKPDNVLVGADGRPRVGDFGIAMHRDARGREADVEAGSVTELSLDDLRALMDTGRTVGVDTSGQLTEVGARIGTPAYMAPEQHLARAVDARADQFAYCVALWEALCGERPFAGGDSLLSLSYNVCAGKIRTPPASAEISTTIRRALERGLSPNPDDRFPSMQALLEALTPTRSRAPVWWGIAAAGAVVVGGVGALVATREDPMAMCIADGEAQVAWNEVGARRLEQVFTASGSPLAKQSVERAVAGLDDFAARWRAAWVDACSATHGSPRSQPVQSAELLVLRQSCLRSRLDAMDALVEAYTGSNVAADAKMIDGSIQAVADLPRFEHCADRERLLSDISPPPIAVASEVAELRHDLERVGAMLTVGRVEDAKVLSEDLLARAEQIDYLPLGAEARFVHGNAAAAASDLELGRSELEAAATSALALGHESVLAESSLALIRVVGERLSDYDAGFVWAKVSEGLALKHPGSEHDAMYRRTVCHVLADAGRVDEAMPNCARGLELTIALWGEKHPNVASALRAQGKAEFMAGDNAAALELFERAYEIQLDAFGDGHPRVAEAKNAVAVAREGLGDFQGAQRLLVDVVATYERVLGREHELTAINRNNLALVERALDHLDEAERLANRSLSALENAYGPSGHAGIGASSAILFDVANVRGDAAEAERWIRRAHEVYVATRGGTAHPDTIGTAHTLGEWLLDQGRAREAITPLSEAVAGAVKLDPTHVRRLAPQMLLVRALFIDGQVDRARETLTELENFIGEAGLELDEAQTARLASLRSDLGVASNSRP